MNENYVYKRGQTRDENKKKKKGQKKGRKKGRCRNKECKILVCTCYIFFHILLAESGNSFFFL